MNLNYPLQRIVSIPEEVVSEADMSSESRAASLTDDPGGALAVLSATTELDGSQATVSGPTSHRWAEASRRLSDWFQWAATYARGAGLAVGTCPFSMSSREQALLCDGKVVSTSGDPNELVAAAERETMSAWGMELARDYFVCHAATVERNGLSVLLIGRGRAGKSTLALALVRRGFRFLGDEYAVVDPKTLEALPFPKALAMKGCAASWIAAPDSHFEVFPYPPASYSGQASCCLPRETAVPLPGERSPVGWVIALCGEPAAGPPVAMLRWEAAKHLYESLWWRGEKQLRAAARLARKVVFWKMGRSSIAQIADWIEHLADGRELAMARITMGTVSRRQALQRLNAGQEARARVRSLIHGEVKKLCTILLPRETPPLVPPGRAMVRMPHAGDCCA